MINRVLIRIKVVQMLYSYLLTEKVFALESQPTPPTKASRLAYALYLDMLALMVLIADEVRRPGGQLPLADNRFVRAVRSDEKIRSVLARNRVEPSALLAPALVEALAARVKDSAACRAYLKEGSVDMSGDLRLWRELFAHVIMTDSAVLAAIEKQPGYSLRAADIFRNLMEETFSNFSSSQSHIDDALRTLKHSLDMARELYLRLLLLPIELTELQARNLEAARNKYVVTDHDLNPNMRFVDNEFVKALEADPEIAALLADGKYSWIAGDPRLLASLLKLVTQSDEYRAYMEASSTDFAGDCEFWRRMFKYTILPSDELAEAMEDKSVFWNDDLDIIGTFVLKTVRRFAEGQPQPVLAMYKDREDATFGRDLFTAAVRGKEEYRALVDNVLNKDSWDSDRLAFMDVVICITAIAEILNFPKIPVNVSINEYIEIAKAYSTSKSGFFINGLLGAIVNRLHAEGTLLK
ncbi:MAG: transcription antitermination protein NusB [Bacteroidales bacterium]|nr:transcription antitermination protein NusB [Bacteroidales bacterium]